MALSSVTTIMPLLLRITAGDFFERVKAGIGWKENRRIYSFGVVLTLMILQRATGRKTLSRTVGLAVAVADGGEGVPAAATGSTKQEGSHLFSFAITAFRRRVKW